MDKIPFSFYDFFGYLAPGVLFVASIDYFYVDQELIKYASQNAITGIVSVLLIYVVGQIISTPSSYFLENILIKKLLKDPREILLLRNSKIRWFRKLLKSYYESFSVKIQDKILNELGVKETELKDSEKYDELFQIAFSKVKKDEVALKRLYLFLNLYGFARNISFTCFLISLVFLSSPLFFGNWIKFYWIIGFLFAGTIMLFRFLKFYRLYTYDMYLSYFSLIEKS